jgi:hypothetical protein
MSHVNVVGSLLTCFLVLIAPLPQRSCEQESRVGADKIVSTEKSDTVQSGVWGGEHIIMEVTESGATIRYDCAHGTIDEKIVSDRDGRFELRGTHVREAGGPVRSDHQPDSHPARYAGRVEGKTMTLTVTLTDTKESAGTFSLTYGEQPELTKCM